LALRAFASGKFLSLFPKRLKSAHFNSRQEICGPLRHLWLNNAVPLQGLQHRAIRIHQFHLHRHLAVGVGGAAQTGLGEAIGPRY
jgi:hypothetical protein